ncbi:SEA (Seh1-associated) complex subunit [Rhodotorula sphaerocarpa]
MAALFPPPARGNLPLASPAGVTAAATSTTAAPAVPDLHPPTPRGGALDALESIAHADHDRCRATKRGSLVADKAKPQFPATSPQPQPQTLPGPPAGARSSGGASTHARPYEPKPIAGTSRSGWRAPSRDWSESRSRERRPPAVVTDISAGSSSASGPTLGGLYESPSSMSFQPSWGGPWGQGLSAATGEPLPPNAGVPSSTFSSFGAGAGEGSGIFFPYGSAAFSFEGRPVSPWDNSYRSSAAGSPTFLEASRAGSVSPQPSGLPSSIQQRSDPTGMSNLYWALGRGPRSRPDASSRSSPARSPRATPLGLGSLTRTSQPVTGGGVAKKPREASRALRFSVATGARDKGLIGLAKPPKEAEQGRVAVAGKTCLRILRVPSGRKRTASGTGEETPAAPPAGRISRVADAVQAAFPTSSIAKRRSRSRGPAAAAAAAASSSIRGGSAAQSEDEGEETISEVLDVRLASKLGPTYLFSDVRWGYGATSNKIATSFSNGAVVLWDLARDGNRIDQLKYEHDRAVNRVVFGGQTGNWLMSGGQDGQMKLWDIRESRPAAMILKASSPIRHLSFSPSASQPFTLLATCASGTMIRYDVRYVSKKNGGATDRIAGHVGACLAMDWRDGFPCERAAEADGLGTSADTAGGRREGGWVVTGGVDRTVKIWDFTLPTLSTKPVRTLYSSQPVHSVAWHPTRPTELASSPMPTLGLGAEGSSSSLGDEVPSTPISTSDSSMAAFIKGESPSARGRSDRNAWKNEVEVWDVRRPYFPKLAIKTDDPISGLLYNDDETMWTTSRGTPTFQQIDTACDSYSLLDNIDRPAATWNVRGDFAFLDDSRGCFEMPFNEESSTVPVDSAKFRPDVTMTTVPSFDPDLPVEAFAFLANGLKVSGSIGPACAHNADVSRQAGRPDASQFWLTLRAWLDDEQVAPSQNKKSSTTAPPTEVPPERQQLLPDGSTCPVTDKAAAERSTSVSTRRASDSSSRSRRSRRSSASWTPRLGQRSMLPSPGASTSRSRLDSFGEEAATSESASAGRLPRDEQGLSAISSASETEEDNLDEQAGGLSPKRLAASLGALRLAGVPPAGWSPDDDMKDSVATLQAIPSVAAASSPSDDSDANNDNGEQRQAGKTHRRSRSARVTPIRGRASGSRSRRPSAGQSSDAGRGPLLSRENTLPRSPARKAASQSRSRRGSAHRAKSESSRRRASAGSRSGENGQPRRPSEELMKTPTGAALQLAPDTQPLDDLRELTKEKIRSVLRDYADKGDSQLCATAASLLGGTGFYLDPGWTARVTKSYLDILRRLDLDIPAARLSKACTVESLLALPPQDNVVLHRPAHIAVLRLPLPD